MIVKPPVGSLTLKCKTPCAVIVALVWVPYAEPLSAVFVLEKVVPTARGPPSYTMNHTFNRRTFEESTSIRGSL